jgi:hypothetical protein
MEQLTGEKLFLDRVGSAELQNLNTRSPEIIPSDLSWDRRMLSADRMGLAFFLDENDVRKELTDPRSVYAMRSAEAIERDFDRCVVNSLDATVYTGKDGTVALSAASDGMITIDATSGATYDVLLQIDANFQGYEIGIEGAIQKYLLITEQEHQQFMKEAELINADYTDRKVVDEGVLRKVMDLNVIMFGSKMTNPILKVSSTTRDCYAVASGAVRVAAGLTEVIWQRRNDRWDTDQLLAKTIRGAVRMEGNRVQKVQTTAY